MDIANLEMNHKLDQFCLYDMGLPCSYIVLSKHIFLCSSFWIFLFLASIRKFWRIDKSELFVLLGYGIREYKAKLLKTSTEHESKPWQVNRNFPLRKIFKLLRGINLTNTCLFSSRSSSYLGLAFSGKSCIHTRVISCSLMKSLKENVNSFK